MANKIQVDNLFFILLRSYFHTTDLITLDGKESEEKCTLNSSLNYYSGIALEIQSKGRRR